MIFPKWISSIAKNITSKSINQPTLQFLQISQWWIKATDSFMALKVKSKIDGEMFLHRDDIPKEDCEIIELGKTLKLKWKQEYELPLGTYPFPDMDRFFENPPIITAFDVGLMIKMLKTLKDMWVENVILSTENNKPIMLENYHKEWLEFKALIMPLKLK